VVASIRAVIPGLAFSEDFFQGLAGGLNASPSGRDSGLQGSDEIKGAAEKRPQGFEVKEYGLVLVCVLLLVAGGFHCCSGRSVIRSLEVTQVPMPAVIINWLVGLTAQGFIRSHDVHPLVFQSRGSCRGGVAGRCVRLLLSRCGGGRSRRSMGAATLTAPGRDGPACLFGDVGSVSAGWSSRCMPESARAVLSDAVLMIAGWV